jgi:hypothetical protein
MREEAMKAQTTTHKFAEMFRFIKVAWVVGSWMLLVGLFAQAVTPGTLAHDVETVLASHLAPAKNLGTVAITSRARSTILEPRGPAESGLI